MGLLLPIDQHPQIMVEARQGAVQGDARRVDSALTDLEKSTARSSRILYLLEGARLASLLGDTPTSVEWFKEAESIFEEDMLRATFTVTDTMQSAVSMVTSDRALAYRGQLFERLFLYYFQALNYLEQGDPVLARIELNKALRDMRWGTDNLPRLRRESDEALAMAGVRAMEYPAGYGRPYGGVNLEKSSDNALIYYLSGLLHQAGGALDRAEIDYRNALAYAPDPRPIEHALATLEQADPGMARLVVIHESDWVSSKVPFSLPVFIKNRSYTLSFPYYDSAPYAHQYPETFLRIGGTTPVLYPMLNVEAATRKALDEAFAAILLRQALRIVAKQEIQSEAHQTSPWLGFAASILSLLSDHPDLRSWLSLPASIHIADTTLPPGTYDVWTDMGTSHPEAITLYPDQITLLHIVTAQGRVIRVDSRVISTYISEQ